ncbi:hypothetical protein CJ030_MR8G000124 [Morella rubra]|uniref:Uncharacterized protein n=1 Tax=Morella rubra TaxID=262757 RepID=A0A6A1UQE6_9ROSI|nr:hypothetical protein CJ030_MR8G000124 [Morella rubra]
MDVINSSLLLGQLCLNHLSTAPYPTPPPLLIPFSSDRLRLLVILASSESNLNIAEKDEESRTTGVQEEPTGADKDVHSFATADEEEEGEKAAASATSVKEDV